MKSSIIIVLCFLTGVLLSYFQCIPAFLFKYDYSIYILPIMMFFVGMSILSAPSGNINLVSYLYPYLQSPEPC